MEMDKDIDLWRAAIEAVKAELESARRALRGAEEAYQEAERAASDAQLRAQRAYDERARNSRNVDRLENLEKALSKIAMEKGRAT